MINKTNKTYITKADRALAEVEEAVDWLTKAVSI